MFFCKYSAQYEQIEQTQYTGMNILITGLTFCQIDINSNHVLGGRATVASPANFHLGYYYNFSLLYNFTSTNSKLLTLTWWAEVRLTTTPTISNLSDRTAITSRVFSTERRENYNPKLDVSARSVFSKSVAHYLSSNKRP